MKNLLALLMLVVGISAILIWQWLVVPTVADPHRDPHTGEQQITRWHHREMNYRQAIFTVGSAISVAGLMLLILPKSDGPKQQHP